MACEIYKPLEFFTSDVKILLILLNQPILNGNVLRRLWKNAVVKVCCDGASNQLYDFNEHSSSEDCESLIPNFICGDLDSARKDVLNYFKEKGTEVVYLEDQNETDFTKGTMFAIEHCKKKEIEYDIILSFPALSGRLDHTLSNINTLYKFDHGQSKPIYLLSDIDVACLLKPGNSKLITDTYLEGEWCGLIPIGCEATNVETTGLKYNLDNQGMAFGECVSTSNSLADGSKEVNIKTSHRLLWVCGYLPEKVKQ